MGDDRSCHEKHQAGGGQNELFGAWLNLLQTHSVLTEALESTLVAEAGISLAEQEVLVRLEAAGGEGLRMADLSHLLLFSRSGITRIVERLVQKDLVERRPADNDRRVIRATLTAEGRKTIRRSVPALAAGLSRHLGQHVTDGDVRALRRVLARILKGNGAWEELRCSPALELSERETAEG